MDQKELKNLKVMLTTGVSEKTKKARFKNWKKRYKKLEKNLLLIFQ